MIKVGIYGATGRVGKLLIENIEHYEQIHLSCLHAIDSFTFTPPKNIPITDNLKTLFELSDIIIDFSSPKGTAALLEQAKITPKPLVVGTTGLGESEFKLLNDVSKLVPVLYSTNMSLGVAVLNKLVSLASSALKEFDIEIVEQHHRYKKDAPSGTALTLGEHAARSRGVELSSVRVSGRDGLIGARTKDEIAVMSLRGGDIVGRHTVGFYNEGEFLELNHTATSRDTFAKGALRAVEWLIKQPNGIYSINDCLGLNN